MFSDERERQLFEERASAPSIQAWAAWVDEQGRLDRTSFGARVLLSLGRRMIIIGLRLTERFGSPAEQARLPLSRRDRVYN
ncbi:MAG: hypothetical protein U0521_21060 [Anaerolineae bacterium]